MNDAVKLQGDVAGVMRAIALEYSTLIAKAEKDTFEDGRNAHEEGWDEIRYHQNETDRYRKLAETADRLLQSLAAAIGTATPGGTITPDGDKGLYVAGHIHAGLVYHQDVNRWQLHS